MEEIRIGKTVRLTGRETIITGWRSDVNAKYVIVADDLMKCYAVAEANGVGTVRDNHGFYYHFSDGEWRQIHCRQC